MLEEYYKPLLLHVRDHDSIRINIEQDLDIDPDIIDATLAEMANLQPPLIILTKQRVVLTGYGKAYLERNERLPTYTPIQKTAIVIPEKNKAPISMIFKNDYIKYTIITVTGGVILYFLYEFFKFKNW